MEPRVLISPRRLKGEPRLPKTAVLALIREDLELLRRTAGETEKAGVRDFFKVHLDKSGRFCLAGPALGAPQAVMVIEKLFALGVERLFFMGWAGSLRTEVGIGDTLLVEGALSEEGTSPHYPLWEEPRPDQGLNKQLRAAARSRGLDLIPGRIWTTDAVFRETLDKVRAYGGQGLHGVDMETSALMTVAAFRKKAAAGLLVVSDRLSSGTWEPGFKTEEFQQARKDAAGIIIQAARG